jgi:fibronectin type 3 domain-containing protein
MARLIVTLTLISIIQFQTAAKSIGTTYLNSEPSLSLHFDDPEIPTDVAASFYTSTSEVTVSWTPVGAASLYFMVYRSVTSSVVDAVPVSTWIQTTAFDDTTADPGIVYHYFVAAASQSDGSDSTDPSTGSPGIRAIEPPTIQATSGTSSEHVAITWNSPAGATSFNIYKSETTNIADALIIATNVTGNSYNDISDPGTEYYYFVKSRTTIDHDTNNQISVSTPEPGWQAVPVVPITASDNTEIAVIVDWNDIDLQYRLFRATTDNFASAKPVGGWTVDATYVDETATPGIDYYYFLKTAADLADTTTVGKFSISTSAKGLRLLETASVSTTEGLFEIIEISWTDVNGAGAYKVYRALSDDFGTATAVSDWIATTSFTDEVTESEEYYYFIKSATQGDNNLDPKYTSVSSPVVGNARVSSDLPADFAMLASVGEGFIKLNWLRENDEVEYRVYRGTSPVRENATVIGAWQTTTEYTDNAVTPGVKYYYFVRASYPETKDEPQYSTWAIASPVYLPLKPFGVTASDGTSVDFIELKWTRPQGALLFKVYRSNSTGGAGVAITDWIDALTYQDKSVTPGVNTNYYVIARASDETVNVSSIVDRGLRRIKAPVISGVSNAISTDRIELSWDAVEGGNAYQVSRSSGTADSTDVITVLDWSTKLTFTDVEVLPGQTYYYFIKAASSSAGINPSYFSHSAEGKTAPKLVTGVEDVDVVVTAFPNPTQGRIYIRSVGKIDEVVVVDMLGRLINCPFEGNEIDMSGVAEGLYLVRGKSGNDRFEVKVIRD